jgi:hypothetical protein
MHWAISHSPFLLPKPSYGIRMVRLRRKRNTQSRQLHLKVRGEDVQAVSQLDFLQARCRLEPVPVSRTSRGGTNSEQREGQGDRLQDQAGDLRNELVSPFPQELLETLSPATTTKFAHPVESDLTYTADFPSAAGSWMPRVRHLLFRSKQYCWIIPRSTNSAGIHSVRPNIDNTVILIAG